MHDRPNHRNKAVLSNLTGVVWTGPGRTDEKRFSFNGRHFRVEY